MPKLLLTLAAVVAVAVATLGSSAAPASAQLRDSPAPVSSIETSRAMGGGWAVSILPYIEQETLHRSMDVARSAAFGIGSILDGWGNRDMDIGAFGFGTRLDGWANRDMDIGAFAN